MCGHGGCKCGDGCGCEHHGHHEGGHGCHGEKGRCECGGDCACEQDAGGCQCGGETESCACGHGVGEHHGGHEHHGHSAEHAHGFRRRFISRAERIAELEAYLSDLRSEAEAGHAYLQDVEAEAKAVEERIAALKAV